MSNIATHHFPPRRLISDDPVTHRIRVTNSGIEPLLYMLTHTIEFHRSIGGGGAGGWCHEAMEAEASAFGDLAYPTFKSHHDTINERLCLAVEEARRLTTSTVAAAARLGLGGGGGAGSKGSSTTNSNANHGSPFPRGGGGGRPYGEGSSASSSTTTGPTRPSTPPPSSLSSQQSFVMRPPPPSLFGGGGGGGAAAISPTPQSFGGGGSTVPNGSLASTASASMFSQHSAAPTSAGPMPRRPHHQIKANLSAYGRPFVFVVNIGRIEPSTLAAATGMISSFFGAATSSLLGGGGSSSVVGGGRRVPMEQWRFYCLKTPHAMIQIEKQGDASPALHSPLGDGNDTFHADASSFQPSLYNLLSNDLSQGRSALKFIADACYQSGVVVPNADMEAIYTSSSTSNANGGGLYFDLLIERDA